MAIPEGARRNVGQEMNHVVLIRLAYKMVLHIGDAGLTLHSSLLCWTKGRVAVWTLNAAAETGIYVREKKPGVPL